MIKLWFYLENVVIKHVFAFKEYSTQLVQSRL